MDEDLLAAASQALAAHGNRAALELRKSVTDPQLVAQALTFAQLRQRAEGKFAPADAKRLLFTRAGLEQATRAVVATRRAERFAQLGATRVADLGCGIGADAYAFARAGIDVMAVEADAHTAQLVQHNAHALGLEDRIEVRHADAMEVDLTGCDAVFSDPARRGGKGRVFDPSQYSPPLDALLERLRPTSAFSGGVALKLSPGVDHRWLPPEAEAEWVAVERDVVEACLWLEPPTSTQRRAAAFVDGRWHELTGTGRDSAEVGPVARYLYEPNGAVLRSGLVAQLAQILKAHLAHPDIAYMYADQARRHPLARVWEVEEVWPLQPRKLRPLLAQRGIGRLTIKQRGTGIVPDEFRKQLHLRGSKEATLVATRVDQQHVALLCREVYSPKDQGQMYAPDAAQPDR
ncbi:class I SAM-dependent methyltransferase [Natronoglycomyces albus]|uniref:class I SAM-dependent methyltransferase n=1 Tax=Natronoglycomyces albus TaxID=2811108 RepID=UPI001FE29823|nr:class I SAM-dependent methyltransferase [Natronoglycomyces albus]